MRCLQRNLKKLNYYLYDTRVPILDDEGFETGEYERKYSGPFECYGNISAGNGTAQEELFGTNVKFNRVIVMDDSESVIDTNTLFCVDIQPTIAENNETPPHDYIVTAVAQSLNSISIAISKVNTDENQG